MVEAFPPSYLVQLPLPPILLLPYCCCYNADKACQSQLASTVVAFNSFRQTLLGHAAAPAYSTCTRTRTKQHRPDCGSQLRVSQEVSPLPKGEKREGKIIYCAEHPLAGVRPNLRKPRIEIKKEKKKSAKNLLTFFSLLQVLPLTWEKGTVGSRQPKAK